ncbi:hypothetical protein OQJ13_06175 [Legionella sp. PATHC035]|uniref:hypothetical protein n=1 Tax=Legionella sp. PATHC035 TaxID=2992040 RepID=UPI002242F0EC|nr:hypothetical protein [Legionella sp. PATHC035]MCW8408558.1 hypothetical protein [Legionella sp. PATHC035]
MLTKLFNTQYKKEPISMRGSIKKITSSPLVVPPEQIQQLLQAPECAQDKIGEKNYKILRFLIRTNGELVFAHEGYPGGPIPAHWQMTGEKLPSKAYCLTAGNVFFDKKNNLLVRINNKSGDFRPPFDSLQLVFPKLIQAQIPLGNTLRIQKLDSSGCPEELFRVSKKEILTHFGAAAPTPVVSNKHLDEDLKRLERFCKEKLALNKKNKLGIEYNESIKRFYNKAVHIRKSKLPIKQISQQLKTLAHEEFHHRHSTRRLIADILLIISCFGGIGLIVGFGRMGWGTSFLFCDAKTAREKELIDHWINKIAESNKHETQVFNSYSLG